MTLPSSGTLSLSDLQGEFGGSNPISMSEYYKSGGNGYVPTTVPEAVTASGLSGSHSTNLRGAQFGGYNPAINTSTPGSYIYNHQMWADNGSTGSVSMTFAVNKTGTYTVRFGWYSYGLTAPLTVTVNGSTVYSKSLTSSFSTVYNTGTFSASAGNTIGISTSFPSSGWAGHYTYIGGNSASSRSVDIAVNSGIPTSGALDLSDFYGGRKT
mgnify:FL=1|tara:strand:- start:330 stop:962 length:633 start_codon:yes stop_codon:yes gene_type:complete